MLKISFNPVDAAEIAKGCEAWGRIKTESTWKDWLQVGRALDLGRRGCMHAAQMSPLNGSGYNRIFSEWLQENGLSEIGKDARSRLFACSKNLVAIEAWRATLPLVERLRLNHPISVWARFEKVERLKNTAVDESEGLKAKTAEQQEWFEAGRADSKRRDWSWHIAAASLRLPRTGKS